MSSKEERLAEFERIIKISSDEAGITVEQAKQHMMLFQMMVSQSEVLNDNKNNN